MSKRHTACSEREMNETGSPCELDAQPAERGATPRLDAPSYFAPVPIFLMSSACTLYDSNMAAKLFDDFGRHLLSGDVAGRRQQECTGSFAKEILRAVRRTCHESDGNAFVQLPPVEWRSEQFGLLVVAPLVMSFCVTEAVPLERRVAFLQIEHCDARERYQHALQQAVQQQLVWSQYAASYDKILLRMPYYREVIDRHVQAFATHGGRRIIDLGAGTGTLAMRLALQGCEVTAVEFSRAMADRFLAKLAGCGGELSVTVLEQSAERLAGIEDSSFDGASILLALFDMTHPQAALEEAIRVLSPGGVLVITEPKVSFKIEPILEHVRGRLVEEHVYDALAADFERLFQANVKIDPSTRASGAPLRAEVILALLREKGFEDLWCSDSHMGNCATIQGRKPA